MKVSLIQMAIYEAEPKKNIENVLAWLEKAALDESDVIVLPEMWNTGYALEQMAELSDKDGQQTKNLLGKFAKENQVIADYDKVHLFGLMGEDRFLQAGHRESTFELDGVKVASIICYDMRFPEWVRTLMATGARVLFVVAEWPKKRVPQWEILLRARAVENQAFVVAVNRVGQGVLDDFSGHSLVIDPLGNVILQAPDNQEGVFSVDIDLSEVEKVRGHIPVFADRKPELYH